MAEKSAEIIFKKKLTSEQYEVMRNKGTEAPFSGKLYKNKESGEYRCNACGNLLFSSNTQFDSTGQPGLEGWPSFEEAIPNSIEYLPDNSHGMKRIEVICAKCKSHLGHIFDDPLTKTKKHFCINDCALDFRKK